MLGKLHILTQKNKIGPLSYTKYKNNSKWVKDLKTSKSKTTREETGEKKFLDIGLGNDFFLYDTKDKGNKSKNRQVALYQIKNLLYSKRNNQQSGKTTYRVGENICKLYI